MKYYLACVGYPLTSSIFYRNLTISESPIGWLVNENNLRKEQALDPAFFVSLNEISESDFLKYYRYFQ